MVVHPDNVRLELIGDRWRSKRRRNDIATTYVNLVCEGDRHRLTGNRLFKIAVERDNSVDGACSARRQNANRIARVNGAASDLARETTEIEIGAVHPLHRHTEWKRLRLVVDLNVFKERDKR